MAEAVRGFLADYAEPLLQAIRQFRDARQASESTEKLLVEIEEAWRSISLEEKQIPYQEREKEFWFGLTTLRLLVFPENVNHGSQRISRDHSIWKSLESDLGVAEDGLQEGGSLPEGYDARRRLP